MLTADHPAVIAFLNDKDPDWDETQTIPPNHIQVVRISDESVRLNWFPINYTNHWGYYEISYAFSPEGPYNVHGTTEDKTVSVYLAEGLQPGTTYYFTVRTYTPEHDLQKNELWSEFGYPEDNIFSIYMPFILYDSQ
jgi:hypothetical protein